MDTRLTTQGWPPPDPEHNPIRLRASFLRDTQPTIPAYFVRDNVRTRQPFANNCRLREWGAFQASIDRHQESIKRAETAKRYAQKDGLG